MPINKKRINDLPDEILYIIANYLQRDDLISCIRVCKRWKEAFNRTNIWKKCCLYHSYFSKWSSSVVPTVGQSENILNECDLWRRFYYNQVKIFSNWNAGRFKRERTGIHFCKDLSTILLNSDEYGNHWLFGSTENTVIVWNITKRPYVHFTLRAENVIGIHLLNNRLLIFCSDYIRIYRFQNPKYFLILEHKFLFTKDEKFPLDYELPDDYYFNGMRHSISDNILVGYYENVKDLRSSYLHVWNLETGQKMIKIQVFQQSFIDFVRETSGRDIRHRLDGGLHVSDADSGHCLVTLIDDQSKLCQINLFDLVNCKFTNFQVQIKAESAWCALKGEIATIFHKIIGKEISNVLVYNIDGTSYGVMDVPYSHNPAICGSFWLSTSKVILNVQSKVYIWSINNLREVVKSSFIMNDGMIFGLYEPKYLLLYNRPELSEPIGVWDIESGKRLWGIGPIKSAYFHYLQHYMELSPGYPDKMVLHFKGDTELSILHFDV